VHDIDDPDALCGGAEDADHDGYFDDDLDWAGRHDDQLEMDGFHGSGLRPGVQLISSLDAKRGFFRNTLIVQ